MRDHDQTPHIIIEHEKGSGLGPFFIGALIGAGVALLFAPRSGKETQEEIRAKAIQFRDAAGERMREAQEGLEERLDRAREGVRERVESVREAVESGRHAAQEAREDLEGRIERSKAAYRAGVEAAREAADEEDGQAGEAKRDA